LLKPPYLNESEGIWWAQKSIDFAFNAGVECCIVIPVRAGNGAMEELMDIGDFTPPALESLETVLQYGINLKAGRVFADTWDLELFSTCPTCFDQRIKQIDAMNLNQEIGSREKCNCEING
jgi:uncharacterized Fe-S cluster-containing MiaB family protein